MRVVSLRAAFDRDRHHSSPKNIATMIAKEMLAPNGATPHAPTAASDHSNQPRNHFGVGCWKPLKITKLGVGGSYNE